LSCSESSVRQTVGSIVMKPNSIIMIEGGSEAVCFSSVSTMAQFVHRNITAQPCKRENIMKVQINTNKNVDSNESFAAYIRGTVEAVLDRSKDVISRVEVHVSDESGHKRGHNDKRCMMEARIEGIQPIAISHHAETLDLAIDGAAEKLNSLIEGTLGRQRHQKNRRTDPEMPEPKIRSAE